MTEHDKRMKAWDLMHKMLRKSWGIKENSDGFVAEYLATFHKSPPPSPADMGWVDLQMTVDQIKAATKYFSAQPARTMYPTAEEIAKVVYGDPVQEAERVWLRIRAMVGDHTKRLEDIGCGPGTVCRQALDAVGGMYYLRELSVKDLRMVETDFRRLYVYFWKQKLGLEP